jgi:hypothetical protein
MHEVKPLDRFIQLVAEIRGLSTVTIWEQSLGNTRKLFGVEKIV